MLRRKKSNKRKEEGEAKRGGVASRRGGEGETPTVAENTSFRKQGTKPTEENVPDLIKNSLERINRIRRLRNVSRSEEAKLDEMEKEIYDLEEDITALAAHLTEVPEDKPHRVDISVLTKDVKKQLQDETQSNSSKTNTSHTQSSSCQPKTGLDLQRRGVFVFMECLVLVVFVCMCAFVCTKGMKKYFE